MTSHLHLLPQYLLPAHFSAYRFSPLRVILPSLLPLSRCLSASSSPIADGRIRPRMAALQHSQADRESGSLIHTVHLPGGEPVEIVAAPGLSGSDFRNAIGSSLFKQWLQNMQSETGALADGSMSLQRVLIQGIDMFGRRVGFLKFKADVIDKSRVPVGRYVLELPAGMLDDDKGDVLGTAVREVEEEAGICLNVDDMVNLTALLDPSTGCKVIPSPGGCDEELSLFLYRGHADPEVIKALEGKETGLREHGELIKVHAVPYDKLWRMTADAKVLCAIALYEMAKRDGLLPPGNGANPSS